MDEKAQMQRAENDAAYFRAKDEQRMRFELSDRL